MAMSDTETRIKNCLDMLFDWNVSEGRFAKCECETCSRTSPWSCLLVKLRPKLRESTAEITAEVDRWEADLKDTPWCICSQIACLLYIWLADAVTHPLVDQACVVGLEYLWPLKSTRLPADIAKFLYGSGMPALDQKAFDEIGPAADSLGNPAAEECAFLSRRLCASILGQMAVAECPDLDVLNAYTRSSTEPSEKVTSGSQIRRRYGWSIPNEASLKAIAKYSPLLEIGGGRGYWSLLLGKHGADVVCYSSKAWRPEFNAERGEGAEGYKHELDAGGGDFCVVKDGGPEVVESHPGRALVLMWPDYQGAGTFGLECLENFSGDYLVLVGEWQGRTYGGYRKGLKDHGQSFSSEFQSAVNESFTEVEVIRIPNWPLFLDVVSIRKRKSLAELMEQTEGETGGDGFLSAFFMGAFDPLGGAGDEEVDEDEADAALVKEVIGDKPKALAKAACVQPKG